MSGHTQFVLLVLLVVEFMGNLKLMPAPPTLTSLIALNAQHTSAYVSLTASAVIAQWGFCVASADMIVEKRNSGRSAPKVALG